MKVENIGSIRVKLASPKEILSWSHGEVTKPETINYRTQRPEKDGLFCERIFGPTKDYQCYCGKYKGIRYKGIVCDRCGVEVTSSSVRRERMGHIKLATPVAHIWFLKGVPSRMGMVLDVSMQQLQKVIYFSSYIITRVDDEAKKKLLEEVEREYKAKVKSSKSTLESKNELSKEIDKLKKERERVREEILSIKPLRVISEVEYRDLSLKYGQCFEAGTGSETLRALFEKIDLDKEIKSMEESLKNALSPQDKKKIVRRLALFRGMKRAKVRPEWMFLTILPVLPPDLRPMVQLDGGRYASSDLNDLYRRVINRNNRLKYLLEIKAPEVIVRNEKRMLQEAVDSLIDNTMRQGTTTRATTGGRRLLKSLADMLRGKHGRFRQNLLGKRVDYSGRSVIVVGPDLEMDQVGLPKKMALELFKPFVIHKLLEQELAFNVRGASRLIEEETEEVWAALEEVVRDKLVLLNRAPTLHRLSIQAFRPILVEGEAIMLHPTVCKSFNADFDGDQMAVYLPLSTAAQKEAAERMLSSLNLLKPATGRPVVTLYQGIALGCYWLTNLDETKSEAKKIFSSATEAKLAYEFSKIGLKEKIKVRMQGKVVETSVGRIIFNDVLPKDFPFQNHLFRVGDLHKIVAQLIRKYPLEIVRETIDKIKNLGYEYTTLSGITWGMDDLVIPPTKKKIVQEAEEETKKIEEFFEKGLLSREEKSEKIVEIWSRVRVKIGEEVPKFLPKTGPVYQLIDAGAKGSWSAAVQMCGLKGLVISPSGEIIELPVKSSYKEGFPVLEYFISTHGARKGTADTALRTSSAGYLTRRLIDVSHDVVVTDDDCGDTEGLEVFREDADEIGEDFLFKIVGRYSLEDIKGIVKKGEIIDWEKGEKIVKKGIKKVRIRSPLTCKNPRGVCRKCYGWDLGNNKPVELGEAVGIVAAQAIGEPGTQLTLRTFHTGGVAAGGDITQGLPRVEEIFERRTPKGMAVVSLSDGRVVEITKEKIVRVQPEKKKAKIEEYEVPARSPLLVKVGDKLVRGQPISGGSLDLELLFKLRGERETWRYIVKEVQRIYASQGVKIHDKHIEIIVRQMFSRVRVIDPGESTYSIGQIIEKAILLEENKRLKKEGRKQIKAKQVLLGISRVSLTTDSFLSAASFQETSRVLIKAALEGKEDKLRGLKENVIIGKLIPVGTGFRKKK